jgi:polysaccharide biosynthesis transport protein
MNSLDRSIHWKIDPGFKISIRDLPRVAWQHRLLVSFTAAVFAVACTLMCFVVRPNYEVYALVSGQIGTSPQNDSNRAAPSPTFFEQTLNSQAQILQSEEVVRRALRTMDLNELYPAAQHEAHGNSQLAEDLAYKAAKSAISVRVEPNTTLLRISFRNNTPGVAVSFTNSIVQRFIDRNLELERDSPAVDFFRSQKEQADKQYAMLSAQLSKLTSGLKIYSVDEQKKLALDRANALKAALALTRGGIADKRSQTEQLNTELNRLRPRALQSKQLGLASPPGAEKQLLGGASDDQSLASDPPLLLVRVYQESVQMLVRLRSELAGLSALEDQQTAELKAVDGELNLLAENESEFERLKSQVDLARQRGNLYGRKISEQQLDADLNANRFTNIRVVQAATIPTDPVFPRPHILIPLALLAGLLAGIGLSLALEAGMIRTFGWFSPNSFAISVSRFTSNLW